MKRRDAEEAPIECYGYHGNKSIHKPLSGSSAGISLLMFSGTMCAAQQTVQYFLSVGGWGWGASES